MQRQAWEQVWVQVWEQVWEQQCLQVKDCELSLQMAAEAFVDVFAAAMLVAASSAEVSADAVYLAQEVVVAVAAAFPAVMVVVPPAYLPIAAFASLVLQRTYLPWEWGISFSFLAVLSAF